MNLLKKKNIFLKVKVFFFSTLEVKKWNWFQFDLKDTLNRVHRQSYKNISEDFMDTELILQDFIRRYSDETLALPLTPQNARIGPFGQPL